MSDPQVRRRSRSAAAVPLLAAAVGGGRVRHGPIGSHADPRRRSIGHRGERHRRRLDPGAGPDRGVMALHHVPGGPDGHGRAVGGDVVRGRLPAPDAGTEVAGRAVPAVPDPGAGRGARGVSRALPERGPARDRDRRHVDRRVARRDLLRDHPARRRRSDSIAVGRDVRGRVGHALRGVRRPHTLDTVSRTHRPVARLHDRLRRHRRLRLGMDARCVPRRVPGDRHRLHGRRTRARGRHDRAPPSRRHGTRPAVVEPGAPDPDERVRGLRVRGARHRRQPGRGTWDLRGAVDGHHRGAGVGRRGAHPGEPDPQHAGPRRGTARAGRQGACAVGRRPCARTRARVERNDPPIRGTPSAGLRGGRRRDRRTRPPRRDPAHERSVLQHGGHRPRLDRRAALDGPRRVGERSRSVIRVAPHDRPGHHPAVGGAGALPGVAHLRRAHDAPATHPAGARRHRRTGSPTRRSVRCSSSCRTGTRTGHGSCGGPTAPSRRNATGSPGTSTTGLCRACRRRHSPSKRRS